MTSPTQKELPLFLHGRWNLSWDGFGVVKDPIGNYVYTADALECIATLRAENARIMNLFMVAENTKDEYRISADLAQSQAAAMAGLLERCKKMLHARYGVGEGGIVDEIDTALAAWKKPAHAHQEGAK